MSPYRRAALFVVRMVAFGFIICSLLLLGTYVIYMKAGKQPEGGFAPFVLKALPGAVGIVLLFKSSAIARRITEDFDE